MEYHVALTGSDHDPGTLEKPLRTISKAARIALPGDVVTVHEGIYREWVNPRCGGTPAQRITYRAAEGEKVTITGAEVISNWKKVKSSAAAKSDGIWKAEIDNSFFGNFNPYDEKLYGDWLFSREPAFHLGEVYLNGRSMYEVHDIKQVKNPVKSEKSDEPDFSVYTWHCRVNDKKTTIYANFHSENPNGGNVEINVRPFVFWPSKPGCGYITVRGFTLKQAATQWAPPTALQEGLIGPHWSKGWIIENNIISDSRCCGISLGKEESSGQNEWSNLKCKGGTQREREVIFRAVNNGWSRDNIGSHIVRNNEIFNCGQAGIAGHLGGAFCRIENNYIHDILHKREYHGAETGGIKLHAAIDTVISGNIISGSFRGVWLDWQAQGTRVTRNVFFDNDSEDLFIEVSHGPTLADHNLFLSDTAFKNMAQGIALVHNFFAGKCGVIQELNRYTPYHMPHSTSVAGVMFFMGGDDRVINNIFLRPEGDETPDEATPLGFFGDAPVMDGFPASLIYNAYPVGSACYNDYPGIDEEKAWNAPPPPPPKPGQPSFQHGRNLEQAKLAVNVKDNLYFNGAVPCRKEKGAKTASGSGIEYKIDRKKKKITVEITKPELFTKNTGSIVDTQVLGYGFQAEMPYEYPDGTPYVLDTDFYGKPRGKRPTPGPFQVQGKEKIEIKFKAAALN